MFSSAGTSFSLRVAAEFLYVTVPPLAPSTTVPSVAGFTLEGATGVDV